MLNRLMKGITAPLAVLALSALPLRVDNRLLVGDYCPWPPLDLGETSSGIASGAATADGRPLLWKSRDRSDVQDMEYHYWDDGRIPFISFTTNGDTSGYYGGVNRAGFALINTDAHNFPIGPHNDGRTIKYALATCRTVDDFEAQLDSANEALFPEGHYGYNYSAIDAYGGAAVFETSTFVVNRFDAVEAPDGFLIRTNHAYTGADPGNDDAFYGLNRHNRAFQAFKAAVDEGELTAQYIYREVVRNLRLLDLDPYPLPFDGYYDRYPYGTLPNTTAICRATTRVVIVVQGVRDGGRPDDAVAWAMGGHPLAGIVTPLWVRAGSVPEEYDGPLSSRLCDRIIELKDWVYVNTNYGSAVDTWRLVRPDGLGLWDFNLRVEDWVFRKTRAFLASPTFSYDRLESFQNRVAHDVADSLESFRPPYPVTEVALEIRDDGQVTLAWGEVQRDVFGREARPTGYAVYACNHPFRDGGFGEATLTDLTRFTTDLPASGGLFFRVEARF